MFSVEDRVVKKNKKKNKKEKKKINIVDKLRSINKGEYIPIIIGFVLISLLIGYYFYKNNYENFNYLKLDKDKYLVYTRYTKTHDSGNVTNVPYINVDSDITRKVNKEIASISEEFLNISGNVISYEYSISGNMLSLVLKMIDNNTAYTSEIKFKSYNINLKTLKLVSNHELLELYNIDNNVVSKKLDNKFKSYYIEELEEGYLNKGECDYACYLEWRCIDNMIDNISYFIRGGKLYAFKEFVPYSIYGEEEYFTDESFKIYIAG